MIITGVNCDVSPLRSAYFRLLREHHLEEDIISLYRKGNLTEITDPYDLYCERLSDI